MFEVKVDPEIAYKEVNKLLDKKKIFPKKREAFKTAIDTIAEAITYGYVEIDEEGKITHTLTEPLKDTAGGVFLVSLEYKFRLDPVAINKKLSEIKAGSNQSVLIMAYAVMATGQPSAVLAKLEQSDKDICDAVSSLFL